MKLDFSSKQGFIDSLIILIGSLVGILNAYLPFLISLATLILLGWRILLARQEYKINQRKLTDD